MGGAGPDTFKIFVSGTCNEYDGAHGLVVDFSILSYCEGFFVGGDTYFCEEAVRVWTFAALVEVEIV